MNASPKTVKGLWSSTRFPLRRLRQSVEERLGHGSSRDSGLLMNDTVLVGMRDRDELLHDGVLVERNRQRSPLGRTDQCFDGISYIGTEDDAVPMLTVQDFPSALSVPTTLAARLLSARSLLRTLRLGLCATSGHAAVAPPSSVMTSRR